MTSEMALSLGLRSNDVRHEVMLLLRTPGGWRRGGASLTLTLAKRGGISFGDLQPTLFAWLGSDVTELKDCGVSICVRVRACLQSLGCGSRSIGPA